jgi:Cu2+-exporting ATPase
MPIAVGAIFMSASTIIVAANAQLLRRLKLRPDPPAGPPRARQETGLATG